jgi:5-methylcytosine-specific restriction endonuclease McrA
MAKSFREYYKSTFSDLLEEELEWNRESTAINNAKQRLRMYANLFNRDCRKKMINKNSICLICFKKENLSIDHIIPISDGGKNEESNIRILCMNCNIKQFRKKEVKNG